MRNCLPKISTTTKVAMRVAATKAGVRISSREKPKS